ncbi:hypothetical protein BLA24_13890 [Streptomyces cinnamoneus]|uniref:Uncharacterized protein n=1 Tax=Streptomyces cinnamoneus TaxID=53446 RepID=A0A2G1XJV5_STRCJ|nr:hypothetical protein [Streptomyces cinnamoneus]PHQ51419.1 hypothetical protein BLA24_13890 [Streptomyces cinnamoneus]PPT11760.1 hypothetical protein CYQ11_01585 [Streptomyces cinnamoneus]
MLYRPRRSSLLLALLVAVAPVSPAGAAPATPAAPASTSAPPANSAYPVPVVLQPVTPPADGLLDAFLPGFLASLGSGIVLTIGGWGVKKGVKRLRERRPVP